MEKVINQLVNTLKKKIPEKIECRDFIIEEEINSFLNNCDNYYFYKISNNTILFKHDKNIDIIEIKPEVIIKKNYNSNKRNPKFTKITPEELNNSTYIGETNYKSLKELEVYITNNTYPKFTSIIPSLDFYLNKRYKNIHNSLKVSLLKTVRSVYKKALETKDSEITEILTYLGVKNTSVYDDLFNKNKENIMRLKELSYFFLIYYIYLSIRDIKKESEAKEKKEKTPIREAAIFLNKILEKNENTKQKANFINRFNFKQLYGKGFSIDKVFDFVELVLSNDITDLEKITIQNIDHYLYLYIQTNSIKLNFSPYVINNYFGEINRNDKLTIEEISEQLNNLIKSDSEHYKAELLKYEKGIDLLLNKEINITIPRSRNFKTKKIKKLKNLNESLYRAVERALFYSSHYSSNNYQDTFSIIEYYHKETNLLVGYVFLGKEEYSHKINIKESFSTVYSTKYLKRVLPKVE